jgi:hypothetical protein
LSVVKGKRIVLIDDSVVRGTTSRKIVQMMYERGAKEVQEAAIGRPVFRRVPSEDVEGVLERLLRDYFERREEGETVQRFFTRHGDEELLAVGLPGEHALDSEGPEGSEVAHAG